tara:strand:+ start:594 stop:1427 length:834 start_codon:yes stop_codon:yes gene_type:complete
MKVFSEPMKLVSYSAILSCLIFIVVTSPVFAERLKKGDTIHVCGDGAGWPPYTFFKHEKGEKTKEIIGYDIEVLNSIFKKHGINAIFEMPPWNRCVKLAETGIKYQIALSASYSKERDRKFILTRDYYRISPYYFYSRNKYQKDIDITVKEDFLQYKVCGLYGYNYMGFNLPLMKIDRGAKNFDLVIKKTHKGRCDLFIARYEILVGFDQIGVNYLERDLGYAPIPGATLEKFYMLISRNYKHANQLKKIIDSGIAEMEKSGKLKKIIEMYIGKSRQ